jgi:hypothetical protein
MNGRADRKSRLYNIDYDDACLKLEDRDMILLYFLKREKIFFVFCPRKTCVGVIRRLGMERRAPSGTWHLAPHVLSFLFIFLIKFLQ